MSFNEPTYEEYQNATAFAKVRYKYGLIITIACWICLIIIAIMMFMYAKELSTHPIIYTMDKFNLKSCNCIGNDNFDYYINQTTIIWKEKLFLPSQ